MSPRTGRPTDDPKRLSTRIRLSEEDIRKLEYCADKLGVSKSEIIRMGIELAYQQAKEND